MGISGLIPFLEKASAPVNIKELRGSSVAVDSYCWLHRGVFCCADKLLKGISTDFYVQYCMKFVDMLLDAKMKVIMVFDGCHLPAKAETEKRRRQMRQESKRLALEYLRNNEIDKARSHMKRAVDVTHEMALELMKACRQRCVDCIVAPYEADAQMAWFNKMGLADYIITEDSDLTLFGATRILFKLDLNGNALLIESSKLYLAMGCKSEKYSFDKFRRMCILSGCDYLNSLPGIGLKKACKFMLMTEEDNVWLCLRKLPKYLNMKKLEVTDEYIENFCKAEATFKHMYIYNPLARKMERLYELEEMATEERYCANAGSKLMDEQQAFQLALGNLNPFTMQTVDNWDPDNPDDTSKKLPDAYMKRRMTSIWLNGSRKFPKDLQSVNVRLNKRNCLESMMIQLSQNGTNNEDNSKLREDEICNLYANVQREGTSQCKRKLSTDDEKACDAKSEVNNMKYNPFSKKEDNSSKKIEIKSRFFAQNHKFLNTHAKQQDITKEMENFEKKRKIIIENQQHLYQKSPAKLQDKQDNISISTSCNVLKYSNNLQNHNAAVSVDDELRNDVTVTVLNADEVIEVEQKSVDKRIFPGPLLNKKIGLRIPRQRQDFTLHRNPDNEREAKQSTLAMFGFQKRPQLKL